MFENMVVNRLTDISKCSLIPVFFKEFLSRQLPGRPNVYFWQTTIMYQRAQFARQVHVLRRLNIIQVAAVVGVGRDGNHAAGAVVRADEFALRQIAHRYKIAAVDRPTGVVRRNAGFFRLALQSQADHLGILVGFMREFASDHRARARLDGRTRPDPCDRRLAERPQFLQVEEDRTADPPRGPFLEVLQPKSLPP